MPLMPVGPPKSVILLRDCPIIRARPREYSVVALAAGFALLTFGCRGGGDPFRAAERLDLAAFAGAPADTGSPATPETRAPDADPSTEDADTPGPVIGAGTPEGRRALTGEDGGTSPLQPGDRVVLDSLVGQINGRPIFANAFFADIDDRLRLARQELPIGEFAELMQETIQSRLAQLVRNEVLLAEAEAALTIEQKQGLFQYLQDLQEQRIARSGGIRAQAENELASEEGLTLDDYRALQKDLTLLTDLFRRKIDQRVIVSWRDIERAYKRNFEQFNSPGGVVIARLTFVGDDGPERAAEAAARLNAAEDLADVADDLNASVIETPFALDAAGEPDGLPEPLKAPYRGLGPNEASAPFELGRFTSVLYIVDYAAPQSADIFNEEVQRALLNQIRQTKRLLEEDRYIRTLIKDGVQNEYDGMLTRLNLIGLQRYLDIE